MEASPQRSRAILRPRQAADDTFLRALYASTRDEELAVVPWTPEQKAAFLAMQFDARERHYLGEFPDADDQIIEVAGEPAGRLEVSRVDDQILIVDLALLPAFRGAGIGTRLLHGLLAESRRTGRPLRLHVEAGNPARRLYERLGFAPVAESPPYLLFEWLADRPADTVRRGG